MFSGSGGARVPPCPTGPASARSPGPAARGSRLARYGAWSSLPRYVEEAQAQDYEDARAQFEAYIDHAHRGPVPSTGTIYWQMNKGWPSLVWNLYGSDGDQAPEPARFPGPARPLARPGSLLTL